MIERRNDPRVMPYLEAARQFCNKVIMKGDMTSPLQERFIFTHGDFNEGNILVTKNSSGLYTITGLLDFEWAISGPEEIEFHRGFRWIKQAEPELREVYWRRLWSELTTRRGKCQIME
jgi:aminoglycoside phosphotransferase (APT) family kinase protein